VVPPEFADNPDQYVTKVCEEMIPLAAKKKLADFVDVFCERGAFTLEQSEKIFAAARTHGLDARAHVGHSDGHRQPSRHSRPEPIDATKPFPQIIDK